MSLCPMGVCAEKTKCQLLVRPLCVHVKTGACYWGQTRGVGAPYLWGQLWE